MGGIHLLAHVMRACGPARLTMPLPGSFLTLLGTVPARAGGVSAAHSSSPTACLKAAAALLPGLVAPRALLQVDVALRQTLQSMHLRALQLCIKACHEFLQ